MTGKIHFSDYCFFQYNWYRYCLRSVCFSFSFIFTSSQSLHILINFTLIKLRCRQQSHPRVPPTCLFCLCLKTKMWVLSCYNFLNHAFNVVTLRVHFTFSKVLHKKQFCSLQFFQEPNFRGFLKELFSADKKLKCVKVHFRNPKHFIFLNTILKRK